MSSGVADFCLKCHIVGGLLPEWPFMAFNGVTGAIALYISYLFYNNYRASKNVNLQIIAVVFLLIFFGEMISIVGVVIGAGAGAHVRGPRLFLLVSLAILAWVLNRTSWKSPMKK